MSTTTTTETKKFPWEYDFPDTPFWNDLPHFAGNVFLRCFTEAEVSAMNFDATLPSTEKLRYLRGILKKKLAEKEKEAAPVTLHDSDYKSWNALKLAIGGLEDLLGNLEEAVKITRERYENGPDGTKDMAALSDLGGRTERLGDYPEAEKIALEALAWIQSIPPLGPNSPQALGSMRVLVKSTWKQGKYDDAKEWIQKCRSSIDELAKGRFAKYEAEERKQIDDDVEELEKWRVEHDVK